MSAPAESPVLEVRGLITRFHTDRGVVNAVNGISYTLAPGEALALVGESGSGKTVAALSVLGLVPPPGSVEEGEVLLHGENLLDLPDRAWRDVRGRRVAMIFQDPLTSLNPVLTVGRQMTEMLRHHLDLGRDAAERRSVELLERVGIPDAARRLRDYPHQLSGGQRQRVMIAMALSCEPDVLIADEPTTALDVTVQAQIVDLVKELRADLGMAVLWITHDLAVVAGLVDRVAVMYAGRIVEIAPVARLYASPRHPYTRGLLRSMPAFRGSTGSRLESIEGAPPDLTLTFASCPFAPRCPLAEDRCHEELPPLQSTGAGSASACWRWGSVEP
ncbi:MAG: ABC transporter ATP-binding protein [Gemmatimonadota bacterium]|nr:ABC transporter ATP-binding protein [Gemmatimonadota bacterium]